MPSFDIVSEVDQQEIRNAVEQASRELRSRYDFRGVEASVSLEESGVLLSAPEEFHLKQLEDIVRDKLASRGVDVRYLEPGQIEGAGRVKRREFGLRQGIDRDIARQIVKLTKDSKIKVQAQVNGEKVRITGKKRDDLQAVMAMLREAEIAIPLQFNNFRD